MRVTFSWDDGHPHDLRLAEVMARHGIHGTFYCPIVNREGLPVMTAGQMRTLAAMPGMEIGAHTHSHLYATRAPLQPWLDDCRQGRESLQDTLGQSVSSFCYPGGKHAAEHVAGIRAMGFRYARTIANFSYDAGADPMRVPTTLQFCPHPRSVLLRNALRHGPHRQGQGPLLSLLRSATLAERLRVLADHCTPQTPGLLHLWGHSWEVSDLGLLPLLDDFCRRLRDRLPVDAFVTNSQSLRPLAAPAP